LEGFVNEFVLGVPVLGNRTWLPITEAEFSAAAAAKEELVAALATEEAYDAVIANLLEFEEEMLRIALRDWVHNESGWNRLMDELYTLNRRLLNLLSAARQMLDHLPQRVGGSKSSAWQVIKPVTSEQYDNLLGYRVMEGVRNYHQHQSFALRRISHPWKRIEQGDGWRGRYAVSASLSLEDLQENKALKPALLEELLPRGPWIDAKPLVREYVEGLGKVQEAVRAELNEGVAAALQIFEDLVTTWEEAGEKDRFALSVIERDADGTMIRSSPVHFELALRYRRLTKKNRSFGKLSAHYVTAEVV
jgi:hypothetical protein